MKKFFSVTIALAIILSQLSIISSAVVNDTDYKSLDKFVSEFVELTENDALPFIEDEADLLYSNNGENEYGAQHTDETEQVEYTNRLIVKSDAILNPLDSVNYIYGYKDLHILQFDNRESTRKALDYYSSLSFVEYAEEDAYLYEAVSDEGVVYESAVDFPTSIQSNIFGFTEAKADSDGNEVDIAVIDSGVEIHHEFLEGRVVDSGINTVNDNGTANDDRGHGTHVAGIIVSNTLDNVTVHAYKALSSTGSGTASQIALAIDAAVEDGMDIINLSMQMKGTSDVLYESVKAAYDKGITVVAAAGNAHEDLEANPYSPAGFEETICVMSCTIDKLLSDTSNYGTPCDIAAPGDQVFSSYLNNTYKVSSGTSMAAPFVCAAAAYLLAKDDTLTPDEIDAQLFEQGIWMYGSYRAKHIQVGTEVPVSASTPAPVLSLAECSFVGSMKIEITCSAENADIFYTTDNSAVVHPYYEPFYVSETTTVNAFALENGYLMSEVSSCTYTRVNGNADDFIVDENGALVEYNGDLTEVDIPSCVNGTHILSVAETAFSNNTQITKVSFENSITEIKANSFKGCTKLARIIAPQAKIIGDSAFEGCSNLVEFTGIEVVEIGANAFLDCTSLAVFETNRVKAVGDCAFKNTLSYKHLSLPMVNEIGSNAFENSAITTAAISTATKIGSNAFLNCKGLTGILLSNVTEIGECAFSGCDALTTVSVTSPSIVEVGENAFKDCIALTTVAINSVNQIYKSTFSGCTALSSLTIGTVNTIAESSFSGFESLSTVKISSSAPVEIGASAFNNCNALTTVTLGTGIVTIPDYCFYGCDLLKQLDSSSVQTVGASAFEDCSELSSFYFNCVKTVNANSFKKSGITSITCNGTPSIAQTAFDYCTKVTSIAFDGVTDIDLNLFSYCCAVKSFSFAAANTITFPENGMVHFFPLLESFSAPYLKSLPDNAFADCGMFNTYNFLNVVTIGDNAFKNTAITTVSFNKATSIGEGAFVDTSKLESISLPRMNNISADMFSSHPNVDSVSFGGITELPENFDVSTIFPRVSSFSASMVKYIPDYYFKDCKWLSSFDFSPVNRIIGEGAFENCNIRSLHLYATKIGKNAFNGNYITFLQILDLKVIDCDFLGSAKNTVTSIYFDKVEKLDGVVFNDFKNLESARFDKLTVVPKECFKGLTKLTTVQLNSVTEIGEGAFFGCESLKKLSLNLVTTLEKDSLRGCTALEELQINSVKTLGENAISGCSALKIFNAPKLEQVDFDFLNGCINIESIVIDSVKELPSNGVSSPFAHLENLSRFSAQGVTRVPDYTFADCKALVYANFSKAEYIGHYAFKGCPLTEADSYIISAANTIAEGAFMDSGITSVNCNASTVGDKAFANCENLLRVKLPQVSVIGSGAFENCIKLNYAELGEVVNIQAKAFYNCTALKWVELSGNPAIGDMAFYGCSGINNLERLNPYSIGSQAFYGTDIVYDKLEMPNLIKISENAFDGMEISNLILENVEEIYDVPENANVLIGSNVKAGAIDNSTTSTIYSPAGTVVSKYCLANGVNYKEFNESNPIISNTPKIIYKYRQFLEFNALGFNTVYYWYGCRNEDCSDAVLLKTDQDYLMPITGENNDHIYKYYYCIAKSTENGNEVNIKSNLIKNTYLLVFKGRDVIDEENEYLYFNHQNGIEALEMLNIDEEYCVIEGSSQANSNDILGTGSKFSFVENGEKLVEYTVVLGGDVNGDGYVDALDCTAIGLVASEKAEFDEEIYKRAAGLLNDDFLYITSVNYQNAVNKALSN